MNPAYKHSCRMRFIISNCMSLKVKRPKKGKDTQNLGRWKKAVGQEDHKIWFLGAATWHPCKEGHWKQEKDALLHHFEYCFHLLRRSNSPSSPET